LLISKRCDRLVLGLILIGASAGCGESTPGGGDGGSGPAPATICPWGSEFTELTLPTGEVKGVLKGMSRNASTTCTRGKGTGGPDTTYLMVVKTRTTVELEVVSSFDTVLAIRTACDDPLTELACNDTPAGAGIGGTGGSSGGGATDPVAPKPGVVAPDAGRPPGQEEPPPAPPGSLQDAHLRVTLNPGSYYVLVDEAAPFGVGGNFTLKVSSSPPPAHASCSAAKALTDGLSLPAEELDVASEKAPSCSGGEARPALFYSARVPSGQRLTVRALSTAGDREWNPVLQLINNCKDGRCLARDRSTMFGDRQLRYVNNAAVAEDVILAVSASTAVNGGTFRLDVSLGEPVLNGTCAAARTITDGQVLRNQDLSEGQPTQGGCIPPGGQALYYTVNLLPQQQLSVTLTTRDQGNIDPGFGKAPLFLALHNGCGVMDCRTANQGDRLDYVNASNESQKVILQVSTFPGQMPTVFDLMVSLPLPPGSVQVRGDGLSTSESGDKATFQIFLGAPPVSPVMIPVESGTPTEGTVSPAVVTFTATDWDKPQTVTVTGVDDNQRDGNRPYKILIKPAISSDPRYKDMDPDDLSVTNRDNEASFTFVGASPITTSESGNSVVFTVVANKKPTADVTLPLSSSDPGEGTVSPASLTFTTANWDQSQLVTVTGIDDKDQDGPQAYKILTGAVTSADPEYSGLDPENLEALNADNEFIFVQAHPVSGMLPCFGGGFGRQIAVDEVGAIHVVMTCQDFSGAGGSPGSGSGPIMGGAGGSTGSGGSSGGAAPIPPPVTMPPIGPMGPTAFAVVSTDGGVTFSAPKKIGITDTGEVTIAGGPPGVAYVVAPSRPGVLFVRTEDGGATWSAPLVLPATEIGGGNVRMAAAGKRVIISGFGKDGATVWRSEDGGRKFQTIPLGRFGTVMGLDVRGDGQVWLYMQEMAAILLKSSDGGATFPTEVPLPSGFFFDSVGFGAKNLYGAGKEPRLLIMPLGEATTPRFVDGLSDVPRGPRSIVVDRADNVTVVDWGFQGLELRRLSGGGKSFGTARPLGGFDSGAAGIALSENAVAVAISQNGQVLVSVQTF
jgi:hypothetical protein